MIEILFFAHSTIVFGVVGVFLMLASLLWAMTDRYPGQTFFPTGRMLAMPLLNLSLAIVAAWIVIAALARFLPKTSVYRRFALMSTIHPDLLYPVHRANLSRRSQFPRACAALRSQLCVQAARRVLKITSSMS